MIRVHGLVGTILSVLMLAGLAVPNTARAADRAVRLVTPPPLRKDLAAMPQIASPIDDAERRINAALKRLDGTLLKAVKACKGADWQRSVDAPMTGPGFLSLTVSDAVFCDGNAHPDSGLYSIVYDLTSGKPVDWTNLLPASLVGTQALEPQGDDTKIVTLASPRLFALYMAGYTADGATGDDLAECKQDIAALAGDGPPPMMAWLDAKQGGLAVEIGLAHVMKPCEEAVIIPVATLRAEGASPALLKAFDRKE